MKGRDVVAAICATLLLAGCGEDRSGPDPMTRYTLEHDGLAERVLGDPERTGADRRQAVLGLAHLLDRAAVDDCERAPTGPFGGLDQERGLWAAELDEHGVRIDLLDANDVEASKL